MSQFYQYFKENMESLGLNAPETLFGTQTAAITTASAILGTIDKLGKTVTVAEVVGAGTRAEILMVAGSLYACYYIGAIIGSIAVATGRAAAGGTSISDVLFVARTNNLDRPWLYQSLTRYPEIYNRKTSNRDLYAARARRQSRSSLA
jgi:hypothetical protein